MGAKSFLLESVLSEVAWCTEKANRKIYQVYPVSIDNQMVIKDMDYIRASARQNLQ